MVPAYAVMIRHDVPDEKYRKLADLPGIQSGVVTVLDDRGDYTGVLIDSRHVLTVGHPIVGFLPPDESNGALKIRVRVQDTEYPIEFAFLHPRYDREAHHGGADLAILRLSKPGIVSIKPTAIWVGGLKEGERFVGVGQGKSGTGKENNEPEPFGVFRAYENTIDYLFPDEEFSHFRTDFDDGTDERNTLAKTLYSKKNLEITNKSSRVPLPMEGTTAAGDSGSGVWIKRGTDQYLAGIASYRYSSMYGGQAGYVNLSHPAIDRWIVGVSLVDNAETRFVGKRPK